MSLVGWLAVLAAGVATWLWAPTSAHRRLRPSAPLRLPRWAQPLPEAMETRRRLAVGALAGSVFVLVGWNLTPIVIALAPLLALGVWVFLGRLQPAEVQRRHAKTVDALPEALDLLRACVRSGQPMRVGVETVARAMGPPVSDHLDRLTWAISVGLSEDQAWLVVAEDPAFAEVARDLARGAAWGTTITDVLAHHGMTMRRRARTARLAKAKAVGVKAVLPLGICYLPAFILLGVVPIIAAGVLGVFS